MDKRPAKKLKALPVSRYMLPKKGSIPIYQKTKLKRWIKATEMGMHSLPIVIDCNLLNRQQGISSITRLSLYGYVHILRTVDRAQSFFVEEATVMQARWLV